MIVHFPLSSLILFLSLALSWNIQLCSADIGLLSFWVPELYVLLETIKAETNATIETYTFGARKFYVTKYHGHNIIAANTGVGISNTAATTTVMLQKFPTIDRIVGSGIAGGVDPSLRVGDVTVPSRWALYQKQQFAKEVIGDDGSIHHEIPGWQAPYLMGFDCGDGFGPESPPCDVGVNTWNYTFIYPASVEASDPTKEGEDAALENYANRHWWFDVDEEMLAVLTDIAPTITLAKETETTELDYQPVVTTGGNGISGPTFVDNADFREYAFNSFQAKALDMETAAAAHVATQFGKSFIFIRSLSDLAGADQDGNVMGVFFTVAAKNAVMTMSAFLKALPPTNSDEESLPMPAGFFPGEDDAPLLAVMSFYLPELNALKSIMTNEDGEEGEPRSIIYGGRKFYRGKVHGADVVAVLTGVGISNAAMTTALLLELFPGVERLIGGGIAGGVNPDYKVGDVTVPSYWSLYQMQLYAKEVGEVSTYVCKGEVEAPCETVGGTFNIGQYVCENIDLSTSAVCDSIPGFTSELVSTSTLYEPPFFEVDILVGEDCGGSNGVNEFLTGDAACDIAKGEASNFGFIFPKTVQTPEPNSPIEINQISEGPTRKWKFEVDPEMLQLAKDLFDSDDSTFTLGMIADYTPEVHVGGGGISGPTFVDNAEYREYVFKAFGDIACLDMESAATAHIAYQNDVKFIFFRSLSDLAGADQDGNVMMSFFDIAAENAFSVTSAFIKALYAPPTFAPVSAPASPAPSVESNASQIVCGFISFLFSALTAHLLR